jgi:single-strand DNA-binding protein
VNETAITVVGNVVDVPRRNRLTNASVTNFRMASTARRYDEEAKSFVDSTTFWVDVACWGELGGNVARSVSKGDPVVVVGNIATDSWETDAGRRSAAKIKATAVGLNLARGWSEFRKQTRADQPAGAPEAEESPAEDPYDDLAERPTDYIEGEDALDEMDSDVSDERTAVPART